MCLGHLSGGIGQFVAPCLRTSGIIRGPDKCNYYGHSIYQYKNKSEGEKCKYNIIIYCIPYNILVYIIVL